MISYTNVSGLFTNCLLWNLNSEKQCYIVSWITYVKAKNQYLKSNGRVQNNCADKNKTCTSEVLILSMKKKTLFSLIFLIA